ncbi:alanine--tRNA ligase [Patulibacter minatonensis]|uniref:alanine--tRNA ligase n=1 Tax=Patulibacter minatonensis TaxID=298163 RepID=UPI0004B302FC|nr:alanine--tRNA ligase [Patulibacter minatonensis]
MSTSLPVTSDEIRETFLRFFEEHGSRRLASASLVPAQHDPSVMLTTAGMHPLKPYFLGADTPPSKRLTSCQKCFRTPDIDNVGVTARHLTCFEMLGNFSIGDYFKREAIAFAWELTVKGFGFDPEKVFVTVFGGDEALGLGVDQESIDFWLEVGVPRERIIELGREDNFWQAGPNGPCGPCTELYLDRGPEYGPATKPGEDESDRFMEFWNLVLMQYEQTTHDDGTSTLKPLPTNNIDTGMGLNRMAMLLQGKETIFETDQFVPLIALGEELSGKTYESGDEAVDRAMRILADHTRGMTFLISDGVVPSNEDRGYVLRRLMRRAVVQGRRIGIEGEFLGRYLDAVVDVMGAAYPELVERREEIRTWVTAEEQGFGRTLTAGLKLLEGLLEAGTVSGADAFLLHDTHGFPVELTVELAEEREIAWTGQDEFDRLMADQRDRSKAGSRRGDHGGASAGSIASLVAPTPTEFTGYAALEQHTTVAGILERDGKTYLKLAESPFYPEGGGQVSDGGTIVLEDGSEAATVVGLVRAGDDQAILVQPADGVGDGRLSADVAFRSGQAVVARVDRKARHATECNHTATHLLHAALRERLGDHVHQAGSAVRPDKLRFDFSHPGKLTPEDVRWVEDRVNERVLAADPVRAITTTLDEARAMGAQALFGEKYGDVVRMVEVGDGEFSRELCGGTHVRNTAEIGVFKITTETSSSANVRRVEAITGPVAVDFLRERDAVLDEISEAAKVPAGQVVERIAKLRDDAKGGAAKAAPVVDESALAAEAIEVGGDAVGGGAPVPVVVARVENVPPKELPAIADRVKGKLGAPGVVVLASPSEDKVALIVAVGPEVVERGVKAGDIVKAAAAVVGGGGGGKPTMAQAGGKDPAKTDDALRAAHDAIVAALGG